MTVRCKADEVIEARLVEEINDNVYEVSEVDYDQVCKVREADER